MNQLVNPISTRVLSALRGAVPPAIVLISTILFLVTGLIGIDFGEHWDEWIHYRHVIDTLSSGIVLPFKCVETFCYNYPSFTFLFSLLSTLSGAAAVEVFSDAGRIWIHSLSLENFRQICRPTFLVLSSLAGVWLYFSLSALDRLAGCIAASVLLLSWEFAYHSRWIAPDAVVVQFTALWLIGIVRAEAMIHRQRWLIFASISAGLATSTKYNAGILFIATLLYLWIIERGGISLLSSRAFPAKLASICSAVFIATFLIVTPGTLLQPLQFIADVRGEMLHYSRGHGVFYGVTPYDVPDGTSYALRLFEYVGFALLSNLPPAAFLLLLVSFVGLVALWQNGRKPIVIAILGVLISYSAYFSINSTVFIVRNFLLLAPLLAFLVGVGATYLIRRNSHTRLIILLAISSVGLVNALTLVESAMTIRGFSEESLLELFKKHINDHHEEKFALSPSLEAIARATGARNVTSIEKANAFAYRDSDIRPAIQTLKLKEYPAVRHNSFNWLGPRETNYNYYPTWTGRDRILIVPAVTARQIGLADALNVK